jgi:lathosterol oxidase
MNQEKSMPIKEDFASSFMKGRIGGFLSIFFGVASFMAVLFGGLGLQAFQAKVQGLPFIAQLFLALFCTDVAQYWAHRLFHEKERLWMFHSIHHSTVAMDWLAGSRTHFIDMFATRAASFLPV